MGVLDNWFSLITSKEFIYIGSITVFILAYLKIVNKYLKKEQPHD